MAVPVFGILVNIKGTRLDIRIVWKLYLWKASAYTCVVLKFLNNFLFAFEIFMFKTSRINWFVLFFILNTLRDWSTLILNCFIRIRNVLGETSAIVLCSCWSIKRRGGLLLAYSQLSVFFPALAKSWRCWMPLYMHSNRAGTVLCEFEMLRELLCFYHEGRLCRGIQELVFNQMFKAPCSALPAFMI